MKQRLSTLQPPAVPVVNEEQAVPAVQSTTSDGSVVASELVAGARADDASDAYNTASSSPASLATTESYVTAMTTQPWLVATGLGARRRPSIHRHGAASVAIVPTPPRGALVEQWLDTAPLDQSRIQQRDEQSHD